MSGRLRHYAAHLTVAQSERLEQERRPGETNSHLVLRMLGLAVGEKWEPLPRGFAAMGKAQAHRVRSKRRRK